MNAFVYKDLLLLKGISKSYLLLLGIFAALSFVGIYELSFFAGMVVMIAVMLPISTCAYDEQAGWDKYAAATPAGRRGVVRGKYLFSLLLAGASLLVIAAFYGVVALVMPEKMNLAECVASALGSLVVGLLLTALVLPLTFQFGVQKGRVLMIAAITVITVLGLGGLSLMARSGLVLEELGAVLAVALAVLVVGALCFSYVCSCKIFRKKEL